jgi:hypothetical protein
MNRILAAAASGLCLTVAGCGLTGDLQRPGPLIGQPGRDVSPADLPTAGERTLPPLPERPSNAPEEDELLGGPGS